MEETTCTYCNETVYACLQHVCAKCKCRAILHRVEVDRLWEHPDYGNFMELVWTPGCPVHLEETTFESPDPAHLNRKVNA